MPCSTSDGMGERYDPDAHRSIVTLEQRVAKLEAAFCGLITLLGAGKPMPEGVPPALREWWEEHQRHPGHRP